MYPKKFSHIGLSVKNIEQFVKWYHDVLGFYIIMPPTVVKNEKDSAVSIMCQDVFSKDFEDFKIAHMSTADGIGIEVFEFEQSNDEVEFNPYRLGLFHFCIQDPNIEQLVDLIVKNGGEQLMPVREYYPNEKPYKMVYCKDPFGHTFEIYTNSYELTYSKGAYQD